MKKTITLFIYIFSFQPFLGAQGIIPLLDVKEIGPNLYFLRPETNIGNPSSVLSIGEDGVLLVDANLTDVSGLILAEVLKHGKTEIDIILNTHYHGDHAQGMERFSKSIIITPANQRQRLMTQGLMGDDVPLVKSGWPDITFNDSITLHYNNEEIHVRTLPNRMGHTDGDAIIYFKNAKVLCVGDYFFYEKFPLIDYSDGGGDLEGYFKNIHWVLDNFPNDTKVIPGHGSWYPEEIAVPSIEDFRKQTMILEESISIIKTKIDKGYSLDKIQKEGLPEKFKPLETKPRFLTVDRWIKQVYNYYKPQ